MSKDLMQLPKTEASTTPQYRQIVNSIRKDISSGVLKEHAPLPSERMIAERQKVSRMTARRALAALELEGLVYSEHRRGRFVSPSRLTYDISSMVSLAAHTQEQGNSLEIDVISSATADADTHVASLLGIVPGTHLYQYTRVFRSKGHAIFVETEHVVASVCPNFLSHNLQQSTMKLMERHHNVKTQHGDVKIRMRGMTAMEAQWLGLQENHAGIELEQLVYDTNNKPFCLGYQMWRGELAEFSARAIVNQSN